MEGRLQRVVDNYTKSNLESGNKQFLSLIQNSMLPNHMTWIVTMWHFGQDSFTEYTEERFEILWGDRLKLFRIYSKDYRNKKKMRIRNEA